MTDKPPFETIYDFLARKRGEVWTTANTQWVTDQLRKIESAAIGLAEMRYREGLADSDLGEYLNRQWKWSAETFGPGKRTKGILSHIRKELQEIEQSPDDLEEWIDVVILALDGFWRVGGKVEDVIPHLKAKQAKNGARSWPAWKPENEPVEHLRESAESGRCTDCDMAKRHAYSDATTPGFFYTTCERHRGK